MTVPAPRPAPPRRGRRPGPTLAASVLPADFSRLGDELRALEAAGVERVQWDVMDGRFVPNLTLDPGFGGQSYRASMEPKIRAAAAMIADAGLDTDLEVDGGIDVTTAGRAARAGATVLVAGTALFRGEGSVGTRAIALRAAARQAAGELRPA